MAADNNNRLLQKEILKVRLLDMLVGDWDRHEGQWQWISKDSAGKSYFYVIPKDRDNAFFHANGILPTIVKTGFMTHVKGFRKNSDGLKQLNRKAIPFDIYFLNELDATAWEEGIREFQQNISDSVIEESIRSIPANVYAQYGEKLVKKLKSRRDGLMKNGMEYYRYLAGRVDITGSDREELFVASGDRDQMVITIYRVDDHHREKIYQRSFNRSETKSIILNGLKGGDHFIVEESAPSSIQLKIFGNEGKDVYVLKGKSRSRIVDLQSENNVVVNGDSGKVDLR